MITATGVEETLDWLHVVLEMLNDGRTQEEIRSSLIYMEAPQSVFETYRL